MSDEFAAAVAGVAALADPLRRRLYLFVAAAPDAVSREQAAQACDVPLHTAKFHLDRLAEEGLLVVEYRRLTGRSGPGAGRPAKLYRRSAVEVSVSLPDRSYDRAADLLATAVERSAVSGASVRAELDAVARERGLEVAEALDRPAAAGGRDGELERVAAALADEGYEPWRDEAELCLRNCPFDALAQRHTELVCGMNLALVEGVTEGLGCLETTPYLRPDPDLCCVRVW